MYVYPHLLQNSVCVCISYDEIFYIPEHCTCTVLQEEFYYLNVT